MPIPEKPLQARGGGGFTAAINDLGVIVGTSDEFADRPTDRGLVWQKEAGGDYKLDITDLGGVETYFYDINNQNQIAGRHIYAPGLIRPLYVDQGFINPLPDLGGDTGMANGINNIGWTAAGTAATATSSPFLLQDGQKINLGSFGGANDQTAGINQFGQVVGFWQDGNLQNRAFVWNNGAIKDLNNLTLTNPTFGGSKVILTNATGINNFGDISAYGSYTYQNAAGATQTGTRAYLQKAIATT